MGKSPEEIKALLINELKDYFKKKDIPHKLEKTKEGFVLALGKGAKEYDAAISAILNKYKQEVVERIISARPKVSPITWANEEIDKGNEWSVVCSVCRLPDLFRDEDDNPVLRSGNVLCLNCKEQTSPMNVELSTYLEVLVEKEMIKNGIRKDK